jgi:hypothetical protein
MHPAAIVDEAELGQLAILIARLTPGQQRLVSAWPMASVDPSGAVQVDAEHPAPMVGVVY